MININFTLTYLETYIITINLLSFLLYSFDKLQAIRTAKNISRVSELKLLFIALVGGSMGAIIAMILFRHKIKKFNFMWKYVAIVLVQIAGVYYILRLL